MYWMNASRRFLPRPASDPLFNHQSKDSSTAEAIARASIPRIHAMGMAPLSVPGLVVDSTLILHDIECGEKLWRNRPGTAQSLQAPQIHRALFGHQIGHIANRHSARVGAAPYLGRQVAGLLTAGIVLDEAVSGSLIPPTRAPGPWGGRTAGGSRNEGS